MNTFSNVPCVASQQGLERSEGSLSGQQSEPGLKEAFAESYRPLYTAQGETWFLPLRCLEIAARERKGLHF